MRKVFFAGVWVIAAASGGFGADFREAQQILTQFAELRPPDDQLRVYQLDWVPTLAEAKAKATQERRPIVLLVVRNSYGNLFTGHC